jgi:hypothetical protein
VIQEKLIELLRGTLLVFVDFTSKCLTEIEGVRETTLDWRKLFEEH